MNKVLMAAFYSMHVFSTAAPEEPKSPRGVYQVLFYDSDLVRVAYKRCRTPAELAELKRRIGQIDNEADLYSLIFARATPRSDSELPENPHQETSDYQPVETSFFSEEEEQ